MTEGPYRYDRMVENALRSVIKESLLQAIKFGLIGNHHFYITFRTDFPGVDIADWLHERYPEEMTIVLQNQYWDLKAMMQYGQLQSLEWAIEFQECDGIHKN